MVYSSLQFLNPKQPCSYFDNRVILSSRVSQVVVVMVIVVIHFIRCCRHNCRRRFKVSQFDRVLTAVVCLMCDTLKMI